MCKFESPTSQSSCGKSIACANCARHSSINLANSATLVRQMASGGNLSYWNETWAFNDTPVENDLCSHQWMMGGQSLDSGHTNNLSFVPPAFCLTRCSWVLKMVLRVFLFSNIFHGWDQQENEGWMDKCSRWLSTAGKRVICKLRQAFKGGKSCLTETLMQMLKKFIYTKKFVRVKERLLAHNEAGETN